MPELWQADASGADSPGIGGLSELRVYSCRQCGVSVTEAEEPGGREAAGTPAMPDGAAPPVSGRANT